MKNDVLLGSKWFKYDKDGNLNVVRVISHANRETVSVIDLKQKLEDVQLKHRRKISIDVLEDAYTLLNPDAYVSFNIVDIGNEEKSIKDVIVSIHRLKDLQKLNNVPYAVCRQNVINTYSTVIMKHSTDWEVGMTMSIETIPEGIDYNIMTACNKCDKVITVAGYLDDNLEDLLMCIKLKDLSEYDRVLVDLYHDHINSIPKEFREEACKVPIHKGYCRYLKQLLEYTDFMYDYERAFGVANIKDVKFSSDHIIEGDPINGFLVDSETLNKIQKAYGFKFINPIFMLFDKDINIDELENEVALIKDATGHVYLCNYIKQK